MTRLTRRVAGLGLAFAVLASAPGFAAPPATAGADELLPDLRVLPVSSLTLQTINGRRLLRFGTIVVNRGPGAFEIRGRKSASVPADEMVIRQLVYVSAGGATPHRTPATAKYAGDGHNHWHVRDVTTYELWRAENRYRIRRGVKIGLCFFDTTPWDLTLPRARSSPYYAESGCATSMAATSIRAGISVGWGDNYPWNFAHQWVDVTGLPGGIYYLRTTVDQSRYYREKNNRNNCEWTRIRIPDVGTRARILDRGRDCAAASVTPVSTFPRSKAFNPARRLRIEAGTYAGISVNSVGTVLRTRVVTRDGTTRPYTTRRSEIPGQPGRWFYVTSGPWKGHWLRNTSKVNLLP